ncbi:MAG: hypothetical protein AAFU66_04660 [Pseudomonadota bacterium]
MAAIGRYRIDAASRNAIGTVMQKSVLQLYSSAIEKMAKSADPDLERVRRAVATGIGLPLEPEPILLAQAAGKDAEWGDEAFSALTTDGFTVAQMADFVWYRPSEGQIWEAQTALAGIEATAIVRCSSMDCHAAMPELEERVPDFVTAAASGKVLAALLAHQRMMFAVVAATGEALALQEYAKRASVALIYAWSTTINGQHLASMARSAQTMLSLLCGPNPRDCAAAAVGMRVHPAQPVIVEATVS